LLTILAKKTNVLKVNVLKFSEDSESQCLEILNMQSRQENQSKCNSCPERFRGLAGDCVAKGRMNGSIVITQMVTELRTMFQERFKILYVHPCVYRAFINEFQSYALNRKLSISEARWPMFQGIEIRTDDTLELFDVRAVYENHEKILHGKMNVRNSLTK